MLFTKILIDCDSCDTIGWVLQFSYDIEQKRIHLRCSVSVGHCCCHCKEAGASHLFTAKLLNGVYFVMLLKWRMFPSFNSTSKPKYLLIPAPPDMFSNDKMQKNLCYCERWAPGLVRSLQKLESYWLVSWWWAGKFMKQIKIQLATPLYWGLKVAPPAMFLQQTLLFQCGLGVNSNIRDMKWLPIDVLKCKCSFVTVKTRNE